MKSIKSKILVSTILTVMISLLLVGGISCFLGYKGTQDALKNSMEEMAVVAAERVSYQLEDYKTIASETGAAARWSSLGNTLESKKALLQSKADAYGFKRYNLLDKNGISLIDGNDYSDRSYYKEAMKGNATVSEPLISAVTGEVTIIVAAPVWQNGEIGSSIGGVVYFVPQETFLNDIVSTLQISKGGSAYMLDANGNTIAHKDLEMVKNNYNTIQEAKTDSSLKKLAAIEADMISGKSGFGTYKYGGIKKLAAYAPVPDTNGWSIAVNAPLSDFTQTATMGVIITIILVLAAVLITTLISVRLAIGIGRPIQACSQRLKQLATGDLDTPVPDFKSNDEVGELVSSTKIIVDGLSAIVKDIDYLLGEMGKGNFIVKSRVSELYIGDFEPVLLSIRQIKNNLSDVLTKIHTSADEITAGASQVSDGAQSLAQGATEQASSVQELAATVHSISGSMQKTAEVSKATQNRAQEAGAQVAQSNEMMERLTEAMLEITDSSRQIGHIITTIEDIAFQTNILALNAAVEAARAGSAGKGFAVVADEVRNLASKSDQAAKATKELIENSIKSVERGSSLAGEVTEALQRTTEFAELAVADMINVANMVESAVTSVSQVTEGLDQISSVVQINSATSEESAAASEELSSQARLQYNLVSQFKLPAVGNDGQEK